ncbi:MAG: DUF4158 domain-containing protein [Alphaproteobacteria bacterium]|jgi:TnpA family transposase|nr:DUF4158 domain-containing protein [Alphaproteobacteria bacterium]
MARRRLLNDAERREMFEVPRHEAGLIQHYTLSANDIEVAIGRYGAANRLGFAVQLCLLRHPGFGLRVDEEVPEELVAYIAYQCSDTLFAALEAARSVMPHHRGAERQRHSARGG